MRLRRIFTPLWFVVFAAWTVTAWPVPAVADPPEASVRAFLETIQKIKKEQGLSPEEAEHNHKQMDHAITFFDVKLVSRKSLGKHWDEQSPQDQSTFVSRLSDLFKFVAFPGSSKFFRDLDITYQPGAKEGASSNVVVSVQHPEEGEIKLDFIMDSQTGRWRVIDVILDGVSMRNNLRSQFRKRPRPLAPPERMDRVEPLPDLHRPLHHSPPSSSRRSHALANVQSASTVPCDTPTTSAASAIVNPPKNRSSTTRADRS